MRRIGLTFVLIVLLVRLVFSQSTIRGKILDSLTHRPIPGVFVTTLDKTYGTITDAMGSFELKTRAQRLQASAVGYQRKVFLVSAGKENIVLLCRSSVNIGQIAVQASSISPVQNVCKLDLRLRPVNTSQEVLRIIPGLFIAQHEGGGKAEQIFLRGFDMDHGTDISVNVDGMPVNMVSHAHGQGYADLHFLIPEIIDHIEFQKGTYNPEYGDFQTGGYINFHTKDVLQSNRIQLEAGMYNTMRLLTMLNLLGSKNSKQTAYFAAEYMYTDGFFDLSQNFYRLNTFFKYRNYLNDNNVMTLEASSFTTRWDAAGLIPRRTVREGIIDRFGTLDSCGGGQTHRNNLIFNLYSKLNKNSSLSTRFYFSDYTFDLHSDFTFFLKDSVNGDQIRQREKRKLFGYQIIFSQRNSINDWRLITKLGTGLRYDNIDNLELSHTKNRYQLLQRISLADVDQVDMNGFAEEIIERGPWLVSLGVRLEMFNFVYQDKLSDDYQTIGVKKVTVLPKMSIVYSLNNSMQAYFKAGKGFHSNDARVVGTTQSDILPAAYGGDLGMVLSLLIKLS